MSDTPGQPMEDILASIRKIIAEDPPILKPAPAPVASPPAEAEEEEDVLELGEASPIEPPAAASIFPPPPAQPAPRAVAPSAAGLMSGEAAEASRKALATLSGLKLDPDAPENTLDGMVREMLRPMLKQWLDANLPELVERIVAREIARIGDR